MLWGFITINTYVILSFVTAFAMLNLALVIFLGNSKEPYARVFSLGSLFGALWTTLIGLELGAVNLSNSLAIFFFTNIDRATYYLGLLIALSFFYFCYCFPTPKKHSQKIVWSFTTFSIAVFPLFFFTNLVIDKSGGIHDVTLTYDPGPLIFFYTIIFAGLFISGTRIIFKKMRTESDPVLKENLTLMFWSLIVGFVPPTILEIILPNFGIINYPLIFSGAILSNIWIFLVAFSIIKHKQMNVRVVTSEILILILIFLLFFALLI